MTMQSESINELAAALAKAQASMHNATLNRVNPHFKSRYADLAAVLDAVREPLGANGLAATQQTIIRDGHLILRTTLMHAGSGQWMASEWPLPSAGKPQEAGSALTYARRYCLTALICNSADEDDDANAAQDAAKRNGSAKVTADQIGTIAGVAPNGGAKITAEQVAELEALLKAKGRTVKHFCEWREIAKIADLPAARFDSTKAYLANMTTVSQ
jgi:protein tyrosine phosphatase (PTP) superfamily phosphohydrolase (DUF442 family)